MDVKLTEVTTCSTLCGKSHRRRCTCRTGAVSRPLCVSRCINDGVIVGHRWCFPRRGDGTLDDAWGGRSVGLAECQPLRVSSHLASTLDVLTSVTTLPTPVRATTPLTNPVTSTKARADDEVVRPETFAISQGNESPRRLFRETKGGSRRVVDYFEAAHTGPLVPSLVVGAPGPGKIRRVKLESSLRGCREYPLGRGWVQLDVWWAMYAPRGHQGRRYSRAQGPVL
jgi:hypothetical protein